MARLGLLEEGSLLPPVACRRLSLTERSDYALITWAQQARLEARTVKAKSIDLKRLARVIPEIRAMTKTDPEVFCPQLSTLLAECGVVIVFLPHISGSFLHGATFREGDKIVLGLTVRSKDADRFWFSLFHELAHVLLGHINKEDVTEEDERAADDFAEQTLIPREKFTHFALNGDFSRGSILLFAESIGIDAGIVVGRLQKEAHVGYDRFHDLKKKYTIAN